MTQRDPQGVDNRANQLNPTHPAYYLARGHSPEEAKHLAAQAALESRIAHQSDAAPQPSSKPSGK